MENWNLAPGDAVFDDLTAVSLLGGGHRYEAYLSWDDSRLALVVAKVLRPTLVADAGSLAALAREAAILERVAHPHLVRGYGAALGGPRPGLVLELVEGPRLSTLTRRYGVSAEQLLPLGLAVASALHHLHRHGVVHLDVKPRNIIMSAPPRLIDVSVARPVTELARLTTPAGTDGYMAPEQADPARFGELGPPADVFGLATTLRECLGRQPAPPGLDALLDAGCDRDPAARPTAAEFHAALEPLVTGLPAPRLGRLKPGARRSLQLLTER